MSLAKATNYRSDRGRVMSINVTLFDVPTPYTASAATTKEAAAYRRLPTGCRRL
jgi:hypothetical protein